MTFRLARMASGRGTSRQRADGSDRHSAATPSAYRLRHQLEPDRPPVLGGRRGRCSRPSSRPRGARPGLTSTGSGRVPRSVASLYVVNQTSNDAVAVRHRPRRNADRRRTPRFRQHRPLDRSPWPCAPDGAPRLRRRPGRQRDRRRHGTASTPSGALTARSRDTSTRPPSQRSPGDRAEPRRRKRLRHQLLQAARFRSTTSLTDGCAGAEGLRPRVAAGSRRRRASR